MHHEEQIIYKYKFHVSHVLARREEKIVSHAPEWEVSQ